MEREYYNKWLVLNALHEDANPGHKVTAHYTGFQRREKQYFTGCCSSVECAGYVPEDWRGPELEVVPFD